MENKDTHAFVKLKPCVYPLKSLIHMIPLAKFYPLLHFISKTTADRKHLYTLERVDYDRTWVWLKSNWKKYRRHFRVWIISSAVFTRSQHLQHRKAQCGKTEPPNYCSWRKNIEPMCFWRVHLLFHSLHHLSHHWFSLSKICIFRLVTLEYGSKEGGTTNVKGPAKIVSAYTATVAEEMIMELYRVHTF